jgi:putative endonuclease
MRLYVVYILHSEDANRHYVGLSADKDRRLTEHREGQSRWTSQADDWRQVWVSEPMDRPAARALEKKIKRRGATRFMAGLKNT